MVKAKKDKTGLLVRLSALAFLGLCGRTAAAQALNCPQPLLFGAVINCGTSNTVVLTPGNNRTVNGCLTAGGAPFANARCIATQNSPDSIQVSIPAPTYILSAGPNTMKINNFDIVVTGNGPAYTSTTLVFTVPIGATLNVKANQPAGSYTGSFTVNANFP